MTRRMLSSKTVVALAMMGFTGGVFAIDLPAPDADGRIVLNAASGNYAATADVVCTQVVFSANNISVDLSAGGGKTISIPSTVTSDGFAFSERYFAASILGGTWDFGGGASLKVGSSHHNHAITFSGTKVCNVNGVTIGEGWRNCTLTLSNGAELDSQSIRIASGSNGGLCNFEILSGSKVTVSEYFIPDETNAGYGSNILTVDGAGSSLSVPTSDVVLGRGLSNDRMTVSNGGVVSLWKLVVGGAKANGDVATNTVLSVDNSTLSLTGDLLIGNGGSFSNRVQISGASSRLQRVTPTGNDPYFGTGGYNEFHVMGGAVITNDFTKDAYIGYQSSNNVVRVSDGATIKWLADKNVCLGHNDASSHNNSFVVGNGGTNDVFRFNIVGHDNRLVVSNGTFITRRNNTSSLWVGNPNLGSATPRNNGVVLCGTKPSLKIPGSSGILRLENESYLRFELPAAELETVPVNCGNVSISDNSAIHVVCDDYLAYLGDERASVVLVRASTDLQIDQSLLDAANAELPDRCKLVVDGKDLVLKIRSGLGFILSFR